MRRVVAIALILAAGLWSCASPVSQSSPKTIRLVSSGWVVENISTGFWTSSAPSATLFYNFWIGYEGTLNPTDLSWIRVEFPSDGRYWTLFDSSDPDSNWSLNTANHTLGGWGRWWSSNDGHWLPLGSLKAVVHYRDGTELSLPIATQEPDTSGPALHTYVTTADDTEHSADSHVSALAVVSGLSASRSASALTVSFTASDLRTNNGFLWLFAADGTYLGATPHMVDGETGDPAAWLNGGSPLAREGSNTAVLTASDLTPATGYTAAQVFSGAARVVVVTTDGAQYLGATERYDHYDYRSISGRTPITATP